VRERTQAGADDDARDGLPETHAVDGHGEHPDEDRRELEVGRRPRPEQLARLAVAVGLGDEFVPAGLHRDDFGAVGAVGRGLGRGHECTVIGTASPEVRIAATRRVVVRRPTGNESPP
jgi:hypothetical protein